MGLWPAPSFIGATCNYSIVFVLRMPRQVIYTSETAMPQYATRKVYPPNYKWLEYAPTKMTAEV